MCDAGCGSVFYVWFSSEAGSIWGREHWLFIIIVWPLCLFLASYYSMSDYAGEYSLVLLRTFWTVMKT